MVLYSTVTVQYNTVTVQYNTVTVHYNTVQKMLQGIEGEGARRDRSHWSCMESQTSLKIGVFLYLRETKSWWCEGGEEEGGGGGEGEEKVHLLTHGSTFWGPWVKNIDGPQQKISVLILTTIYIYLENKIKQLNNKIQKELRGAIK